MIKYGYIENVYFVLINHEGKVIITPWTTFLYFRFQLGRKTSCGLWWPLSLRDWLYCWGMSMLSWPLLQVSSTFFSSVSANCCIHLQDRHVTLLSLLLSQVRWVYMKLSQCSTFEIGFTLDLHCNLFKNR